MSSCQTIFEHPSYIPPKKQEYIKLVDNLKRLLKSDAGHSFGEYKQGDLSPFKGYPRGNVDRRCLFLLCKDCKKEVIKPNCPFCEKAEHSMNDAVLFIVGNHKEVYGSKGKKLIKTCRG